jgi:hypothetical protein
MHPPLPDKSYTIEGLRPLQACLMRADGNAKAPVIEYIGLF